MVAGSCGRVGLNGEPKRIKNKKERKRG